MARRKRNIEPLKEEDEIAYQQFRQVQKGRIVTKSGPMMRWRDMPADALERRIRASLEARVRFTDSGDWSHRIVEREQ